MKKQFLNLGKALNKAEQRSINGGNVGEGCCNTVVYEDGYSYVACNGQSQAECQSMVGLVYEDLGGIGQGSCEVTACSC